MIAAHLSGLVHRCGKSFVQVAPTLALGDRNGHGLAISDIAAAAAEAVRLGDRTVAGVTGQRAPCEHVRIGRVALS
jgi:hypothetical protein